MVSRFNEVRMISKHMTYTHVHLDTRLLYLLKESDDTGQHAHEVSGHGSSEDGLLRTLRPRIEVQRSDDGKRKPSIPGKCPIH